MANERFTDGERFFTDNDRERVLAARAEADAQALLERFLGDLSPRQREVLLILRLGLTMTTAARILGVKRETVHSYLVRIARKYPALAERLGVPRSQVDAACKQLEDASDAVR